MINFSDEENLKQLIHTQAINDMIHFNAHVKLIVLRNLMFQRI